MRSARATDDEAEARYARLATALSDERDASPAAGRKRGFGASALTAKGKIFALLSSRGWFVVKLPRARVDALVAARAGRRFDPGHGRVMQEWLEVATADETEWLALAREAREFVARKS